MLIKGFYTVHEFEATDDHIHAAILLNKESALRSIKSKTSKKNIFQKILYYFQYESLPWDFCTFSKSLHKSFMKYIKSQLKDKRKCFVLIGHPKNFTNEKELQYLINISKMENFQFITLKDYVNSIL